MTSLDDVEEKTRSLVSGALGALPSQRLLAIWDGGYVSCGLPQTGKLVLGRGQQADLRISATSVSREHALVRVGDELTIEDLGSANGTRLEGLRLEPGRSVPLAVGRLVELGDALLLLQDTSRGAQHPEHLLGGAGQMERLHRLADLVARGTLSIILQGETGVGKEVMAKRIHERSARAAQPFLKLNCAAFAESMVESELFGHERGAFTGASQAKVGLLEAASGGTMLLDEVAELSLPIQAKLLRAIGNAEVLRIGSVKPRPIDVRFMAATNRDFEALLRLGLFRADLFFRLNGVTLSIPPLRERRDEIASLAQGFLAEENALGHAPPARLSAAALGWLERQDFPGNIRELRSTLQRGVLLASGGPIDVSHLSQASAPLAARQAREPSSVVTEAAPRAGENLRDEVERVERERIASAMASCGGNQTKAAELLGISRRALIHRLDSYGLPRPRKGA